MDIGIDIGNSNVTLGFKQDNQWKSLWRFITTTEDPFLFYRNLLLNELLESQILVDQIRSISLSSVVPNLTPHLVEVVKDVFGVKPYLISTSSYPPLTVNIDNPEQLGLDLYANAVAAYRRFEQSVIIVDFGTALTFTSVNTGGILEGVAITPGLKTAMKALSGNTAQLPEVNLLTPNSPIGKNTSDAIRSGILYGYVGLVSHLLKETKVALGGNPKTIATGGLSKTLPLLKDQFDVIDFSLTLGGIIEIGRYVQNNKAVDVS